MWRMTRDQIIQKLKEREADLRAQGVAHAALFGSVARGDDRPDSDIDILVDLDPAIVVTIFDYAGVKDFIADMFDRPVDAVSRESLKPHLRPRTAADAIYAF
jgi:predicted nucleotidyltransferase